MRVARVATLSLSLGLLCRLFSQPAPNSIVQLWALDLVQAWLSGAGTSAACTQFLADMHVDPAEMSADVPSQSFYFGGDARVAGSMAGFTFTIVLGQDSPILQQHPLLGRVLVGGECSDPQVNAGTFDKLTVLCDAFLSRTKDQRQGTLAHEILHRLSPQTSHNRMRAFLGLMLKSEADQDSGTVDISDRLASGCR